MAVYSMEVKTVAMRLLGVLSVLFLSACSTIAIQPVSENQGGYAAIFIKEGDSKGSSGVQQSYFIHLTNETTDESEIIQLKPDTHADVEFKDLPAGHYKIDGFHMKWISKGKRYPRNGVYNRHGSFTIYEDMVTVFPLTATFYRGPKDYLSNIRAYRATWGGYGVAFDTDRVANRDIEGLLINNSQHWHDYVMEKDSDFQQYLEERRVLDHYGNVVVGLEGYK